MTTEPASKPNNRLLVILISIIGLLLLIVVAVVFLLIGPGPGGEHVSKTWTVTDLSR